MQQPQQRFLECQSVALLLSLCPCSSLTAAWAPSTVLSACGRTRLQLPLYPHPLALVAQAVVFSLCPLPPDLVQPVLARVLAMVLLGAAS